MHITNNIYYYIYMFDASLFKLQDRFQPHHPQFLQQRLDQQLQQQLPSLPQQLCPRLYLHLEF